MKRYGHEFADLWLLFIPWHFPLHTDLSITGASKEAEEAFMKTYPAVYNHLLQFKNELSARNQSETGIRYEWYALQRWGANYWEDFSKQKIVYPEITKFLNFYHDANAFYVNNKCFILTGKHIFYLTAFLNSSLFKFCFKDNFPELLGGTRELRKVFIEEIPVLQVDDIIENRFRKLIETVYHYKALEMDTRHLEIEIDELVFDLYSLSAEEKNEIGFIEIQ